jgi:hypothetical protein
MNRTLPAWKKVVFYCILLALPLLIVELALQLFYFVTVGATLSARMEIPIYRNRSPGCYGLAKNLHYQHQTPEYRISIITDEHGFRTQGGNSLPVDGQDGAARVMLLGPSFAFGWGTDYKDSFAGRLDEKLSGEIINAGVPAQPQSMQLCWLAYEGYKFDRSSTVVGRNWAVLGAK